MIKASIKEAKATFVNVNADEATMSSVVHVPRQVLTLQGINIQLDRTLHFSATFRQMEKVICRVCWPKECIWYENGRKLCFFSLENISNSLLRDASITSMEVLNINQLGWRKYTF